MKYIKLYEAAVSRPQHKYRPGGSIEREEWRLDRIAAAPCGLTIQVCGGVVIQEDATVRVGPRDGFWGVRRTAGGVEGDNMLGRLLMELREALRKNTPALKEPPAAR